MDTLLNIMRALADPTRLRMALLVSRMELSVGEMALILDQSQPRVSRHIRILDEANIIERRREGSWVFLRSGSYAQLDALNAILQAPSILASETVKADMEKLEKVRATRSEMAENYFAKHAEQWDQIRSLHISDTEVEAEIKRLLGAYTLGRVLDVGTGTGRMVELFADQSEHIVALDNSPEMLRVARAKFDQITKNIGNNIDVMLGDFNDLPINDGSFDTLILHQVLHYAQDPKQVIKEAARVLSSNGRLMIVDFSPHNVEELRKNHAHARLGFSTAAIEESFGHAHIHLAHHVALPSKKMDGEALTVSIWLGQKTIETKNIKTNYRNSEASPKLNGSPKSGASHEKVSTLKVIK